MYELCIDWMKFLNSFQAQYMFAQADDLLDSEPTVKLGSLSLSIAVKTAVVAVAESAVIIRKKGYCEAEVWGHVTCRYSR
jgi:hypothetical protein